MPAYVRRYPLVMAKDTERPGRLALCIDRDSDRIIATSEKPGAESGVMWVPLFKGSEPADATRKALGFCNQFQLGLASTGAMIEGTDALGLFSPRRSTVTLGSGEVLNLSDFQAVDEYLACAGAAGGLLRQPVSFAAGRRSRLGVPAR